MLNLELTRIFVKVAQNGSFSRAAEILNLPKSTVSKSITRLEKETGTKLITRTTRNLKLTAAGQIFYDRSLEPIQILEDAQKSLSGTDSQLSGLVRMTSSEDLGIHIIAPAMAQLTLQYPALRFDLQYSNQIVDLAKEGFDLAVRIGKVHESSFKIKKTGEVILILVASPQYLKNNIKINEPATLKEHKILSLTTSSLRSRWSLKSKNKNVHINIQPTLTSNQMSGLRQLALHHAGVALVPHYLCKEDIEQGRLIHVLPEWISSNTPVSIISPLASSSSARLKVTLEHLSSALQKALTP